MRETVLGQGGWIWVGQEEGAGFEEHWLVREGVRVEIICGMGGDSLAEIRGVSGWRGNRETDPF